MANGLLGQLFVEVTADTKKYDKNIDKTEKRTNQLASGLSSLSKTASIAIAGIGLASVKLASDLNESVNATNIVFGESASIIQEWGKVASEQAGLSQAAFNESSALIGTLLKKTGADLDTVANDTINVTKRAADLASVFNKDLGVATTAIGAALRGETEPIRQFAIDVSAAAVEAEALSSGLINNKNELTEAIKVQARYNLILKQSADVAGDFVNTNDELANSGRVLKADLENLGAEIGQAFLPLAKDIVVALRDAVESFSNLDDGSKKLVIGLGATVVAIAPAIKAVTALKVAFAALNPTVTIVLGSITALVAGVKLLQNARIDKLTDQFSDLIEETGKTAEEIGNIDERLRILINANYDDINAAMKQLGEETDLTRSQVIKLALASDNLFEEEKKGLEESLAKWEAFEAERARVLKLSQEATTQAEKEQAAYEASQLAIREQYLSAQELISQTISRKEEEVNLNQELLDQLDQQILSLQAVAFADEEIELNRIEAIEKLKQERQELFDQGSEEVQARKELETQYNDLVFEQTASRLDLLNREKEEAIIQAEEVGAEKQAILEFYAEEEKKIIADIKRERQQALETNLKNVDNWSGQVLGIIDNIQQTEINTIEASRNARIEALNQQGLNEEEFAEKKKQIEKDAAIEIWKIQKEQLAVKKANDAIAVTINGVVAATRALAELGPIAGPIAAGVIAAGTAASLAQIATQPDPPRPQLNTGAVVPGSTSGIPVTVGENQYPELIMSTSPQGRPLMEEFAKVLSEAQGNQEPRSIIIQQSNLLNLQDESKLQDVAELLFEPLEQARARRGL